MSKSSFQVKPLSLAAHGSSCDVTSSFSAHTRPSLVLLESGIQALIEITGFTYIEDIPVAIAGFCQKEINPSDFLVVSGDGMNVKLKG